MDILIRDVPEDVAQALTEKALRDGTMDRQAWLRKKLTELARVPERYAFRVYGQSGGKGAIRRHSDHPNGTSTTFSNFSQPEASAMEQAENLIRRNGVGDKEKAYNLLVEQFGTDQVFEVPV